MSEWFQEDPEPAVGYVTLERPPHDGQQTGHAPSVEHSLMQRTEMFVTKLIKVLAPYLLLIRNIGLKKFCAFGYQENISETLSSFWYSPISWLMHLSRVSALPICSTSCVITMASVFFPLEIGDATMGHNYSRYHTYKV